MPLSEQDFKENIQAWKNRFALGYVEFKQLARPVKTFPTEVWILSSEEKSKLNYKFQNCSQ